MTAARVGNVLSATQPTLEVLTSPDAFRQRLERVRRDGRRVGLVPTMGFLHDGHASLIRRAAGECDVVAVTVFVNPLQFGSGEDLDTYPHDLDHDRAVVACTGASVLFAPSVEAMYPHTPATVVDVASLTAHLEGASRPGHFGGVANVVAKLLNLAGPCRAYFGEKDYQQLVVVRRLVADLSFPVEVVGCPTVRESDGLACSSRNVRLTPEERGAARVLWRALRDAAAAVDAGERDPHRVRDRLAAVIGAEPLAALDYAEAVDASTLGPPGDDTTEVRLMLAARVGSVRLIDNVGVAW